MPKSLKLLRPCAYAGKKYPAGAIVDVRSQHAVILKALKFAEDEPPKPEPKPDPPKPAPMPERPTFPPIADLPPLLPNEPKAQPKPQPPKPEPKAEPKKSPRRTEDE